MNFWMTMTYGTFMKWQVLAIASGAAMVGSWWLMSKWEHDYDEARKAGVVK